MSWASGPILIFIFYFIFIYSILVDPIVFSCLPRPPWPLHAVGLVVVLSRGEMPPASGPSPSSCPSLGRSCCPTAERGMRRARLTCAAACVGGRASRTALRGSRAGGATLGIVEACCPLLILGVHCSSRALPVGSLVQRLFAYDAVEVHGEFRFRSTGAGHFEPGQLCVDGDPPSDHLAESIRLLNVGVGGN